MQSKNYSVNSEWLRIKKFTVRVLRYLGKITQINLFNQLEGQIKIKPVLTPEERQNKLSAILDEINKPLPEDKGIKRVEIIVLKYKNPEVEVECAKNVIANTDWPFKLNFYDNRPGTKNTAKIWNKIFKESTCDYVLLLDSDAFVPKLSPCWLTRMMSTFEKDNCWVVLPRVTNTSCSSQRANKAEEIEPTILTSEPFAGQCTLIKKAIFDQVGYFDEEFLFYGQDTEWSSRIQKLGFNTYIRHDVLVNHIGHYSLKKAKQDEVFEWDFEKEYSNNLIKEKAKH